MHGFQGLGALFFEEGNDFKGPAHTNSKDIGLLTLDELACNLCFNFSFISSKINSSSLVFPLGVFIGSCWPKIHVLNIVVCIFYYQDLNGKDQRCVSSF
jgi:hypothetical protein